VRGPRGPDPAAARRLSRAARLAPLHAARGRGSTDDRPRRVHGGAEETKHRHGAALHGRPRILVLCVGIRLAAGGFSRGAIGLGAHRLAAAFPGDDGVRPGRRRRGGRGSARGVRAMKVSVVVPVYNEEGNLPALLPRLLAALDGTGEPYEILFVDDGSRD